MFAVMAGDHFFLFICWGHELWITFRCAVERLLYIYLAFNEIFGGQTFGPVRVSQAQIQKYPCGTRPLAPLKRFIKLSSLDFFRLKKRVHKQKY